ncbi:hypothetical protein EKO27_g959 [Xylaria grammica]|uniref:Uncharacterized protein n=1 Tax=Xylaria grammica TaxID=363999 RepID=A0A439DIC9_9PEZI|nr:hypothetical protein EKO27_g959 [Xylaria grammica]
MLDAGPGTDSSVSTSPVLFNIWPETGVVIEVTNVLGKPVALGIVELTRTLLLVCTAPVWAWLDWAGSAVDENVRLVIVPDSVTTITVSLQVVSIDNEGTDEGVNGGVDESVTIVAVPDSMRVVSLHVVSIGDGGGVGRSEENVTTVVVLDCVIVLSLHVVSQENGKLGAMEVGPIEVMLVILGSEEACITVKDPDATVDPAVLAEAIVDSRDEVAPVVKVPKTVLFELVAVTDEILLKVPDDNGIGPVSGPVGTDDGGGVVRLPLELAVIPVDEVLFDKPDDNGPVLAVGIVVGLVPVMVVGSIVSTVDLGMVVSPAVVNVLFVTVVGVVNVATEEGNTVLLMLELNAELAEPGGLLVRVEFVTGYGAELDGCTGMAEEPALALVRLAPGETSETGEVPEDVDGVAVAMDVVNSALETGVGLVRPDELVTGDGGILDNGPVELMFMLVSRLEAEKGGTVFVSRPGVVIAFDDWPAEEGIMTLLASEDEPPDCVGPLVAAVELGNGYGPVEEPIMDADVSVGDSRPVPESETVLGSPDNPDVELLMLIVDALEGVVVTSVEELRPLVRLPLGFTEVRPSEEITEVIRGALEPLVPEGPVGPIVAVVELVIENGAVGRPLDDPVPDMDSLELLSGKGVVDEMLEKIVPEENSIALLAVVSEEPDSSSVAVEEDPVPGRLAVPLLVNVVEVVERETFGNDPVTIEEDSVLGRVVISPTPDEVELLGGYRAVWELFCEVPTEVVACPNGGPFVDTLADTDPPLELVGTPVPPAELPVGPTVGSEEFVMGKGVTSLTVRELATLETVDNVAGDDPDAGAVKEVGRLNEIFVVLTDGSDRFVCGKEVVMLVRLVVSIDELATKDMVASLALKIGPVDMRVLVSPIEPPAGLTVGAEEFVNGRAVSLALGEAKVRFALGVDSVAVVDPGPEVADVAELSELVVGPAVKVVELVDDGRLVPPALGDHVVFVETGVGIVTNCVDVFVSGYGMVSLALELVEAADSGIDDSVVSSPEVEVKVILGRLLAMLLVRADEFVRGIAVVPVTLIEMFVIIGLAVVGGTVENPVLNIELVSPFGPGAIIVEFESGPLVPVIEKELLAMLLLKLEAEPMLVKDSCELGTTKLEESRLEVLVIPGDGDVKLLVNVELVNGYRAVELDPDGGIPAWEFPEAIVLGPEEWTDVFKVGTAVEFVKGYGVELGMAPVPGVKPLDTRLVPVPVMEGRAVNVELEMTLSEVIERIDELFWKDGVAPVERPVVCRIDEDRLKELPVAILLGSSLLLVGNAGDVILPAEEAPVTVTEALLLLNELTPDAMLLLCVVGAVPVEVVRIELPVGNGVDVELKLKLTEDDCEGVEPDSVLVTPIVSGAVAWLPVMVVLMVGKSADEVARIELGLGAGPLETDRLPWLTSEYAVEESPCDDTIIEPGNVNDIGAGNAPPPPLFDVDIELGSPGNSLYAFLAYSIIQIMMWYEVTRELDSRLEIELAPEDSPLIIDGEIITLDDTLKELVRLTPVGGSTETPLLPMFSVEEVPIEGVLDPVMALVYEIDDTEGDANVGINVEVALGVGTLVKEKPR